LIDKLRLELKNVWQKPLPGLPAQMLMAPGYRKEWMKLQEMDFPNNAKQAATMCLLYPKNQQLHFVVMKRVTYPGAHSGQISFPGGQLENNELPLQAAIRETFEETGVSIEEKNTIGQLTKIYIPPSNFVVFPFLSVIDFAPDFIPEIKEVDYLIEVPLIDLLQEKNSKTKKMKSKGVEFDAPYFDLKNEVVWGATAIMLSEVKSIVQSIKTDFSLNI